MYDGTCSFEMTDIKDLVSHRIYVASSWRNTQQPVVVKALQDAGHDVYDFRNPAPGIKGFSWSQIDPSWKAWSPSVFREALKNPIAEAGYLLDWEAMDWADTGVLVLPCGRSAHIEAGYFVGARKRLIILLAPGEPELMYKMSSYLCVDIEEVLDALRPPGFLQAAKDFLVNSEMVLDGLSNQQIVVLYNRLR